MTYLQSIILGIIEGATEYLPVSSTFHLIWASKFIGVEQTEFQKAYEVIIQGGAILAITILYFKTFIENINLVKKVIFSFLPTAILGMLMYKIIKDTFFESFNLQLLIFAAVGLFFIYFERKDQVLKKTLNELTYRDSFVIGLIQVLAVFPGVSRAGAVIVGMMIFNYKRSDAAIYSFLLAVPTLAAASVLDLYKSIPILSAHPENIGVLLVGFITSFITAQFVVKWFIKYTQKNTLKNFGYYRIILSILLYLIFKP